MKNSTEQKGLDSVVPSAELQVIEKIKSGEIKTFSSEARSIVKDGFILCSKCFNQKPATEEFFHKSKIKESSKVLVCIKCHNKKSRSYARKNKDEAIKRHKDWRDKNREHVRMKSREWKYKNKEKIREWDRDYMKNRGGRERRRVYERVYYAKNREKMIAISCAYDSRVRNARPSWQEQKEINEYYKDAKSKGLEVDHIVPINSDLVCGLHCVDNFQMLTREENASKGNRHWPDMP